MGRILRKVKKVYRKLWNREILSIPEADEKKVKDLCSREIEYGLNKEPRKQRIVVSLTSFPARFPQLHFVIRSILVQTMKPDKLILYLDQEVNPDEVPESLKELQKYGFQIEYRAEKIKPHKKYYYAMREYPDHLIITIDDDIIYPKDLIEGLFLMHQKHPECVIATRAHRMTFDYKGNLDKYNHWEWEWWIEGKPSMRLMATGVGGVLYPAHCMSDKLFDLELIKKLSLNADDLWLKVMQVLVGTKVVVCDRHLKNNRLSVPGTQEVTLNAENVHQNANDIYMQQLMEFFSLKAEDFR